MNSDDRYDSLFQFYGERYVVKPKLLKAQVKVESNFNPDAVNPKSGAVGLAQFMPMTWDEWRDGTPGIQELIDKLKLLNPRDPEDAIHAQAAYMNWLIRAAGDGEKALAAYNWGIGNFKKCLAEHGDAWRDHLPDETRDYIPKIQKQFAEYSK